MRIHSICCCEKRNCKAPYFLRRHTGDGLNVRLYLPSRFLSSRPGGLVKGAHPKIVLCMQIELFKLEFLIRRSRDHPTIKLIALPEAVPRWKAKKSAGLTFPSSKDNDS